SSFTVRKWLLFFYQSRGKQSVEQGAHIPLSLRPFYFVLICQPLARLLDGSSLRKDRQDRARASVDLPVPSGFLVQQDRPRFDVNSGNVRSEIQAHERILPVFTLRRPRVARPTSSNRVPPPRSPPPPVLLRPPPRHERGTAPVEPRCTTSAKHRRPYRPARPRWSAADRPPLLITSALPPPSRARPASVRPWRAGRPSARSRDSIAHGGEAVGKGSGRDHLRSSPRSTPFL